MIHKGIVLKKGKEVIFKNKHLWIFSGAIASFPNDFQNGSIYPIYSHEKQLLGYGYFHQGISLCGRIVSFGEKNPKESIFEKIDQAIELRDSFIDQEQTNSYRLINGEADLLPGLIVDQYDRHLVLQSSTLGIDRLKDEIVSYLIDKKRYHSIHEKSTSRSRKEEKLKDEISTLFGTNEEEFLIKENGLQFFVNWAKGQKTGFFLDQRTMRNQIKELSFQKKVLNCFCYSGGFSVYALAGQAKAVDSVDISATAIELAKRNLEINHFFSDQNQLIVADVFEFLNQSDLNYDLIILDPPAFAKKKQDVQQACKGYRQLNAKTIAKMPKGSILLTCSCSYYIDEDLFQTVLFQAAAEAKRNVQIIGKHLLGYDHPINLFHPESDYLKSFLLYIT